MCAVRSGNHACVRFVLSIPGVDVNAANKNGETPLMLAAEVGDKVLVQWLLDMPGIDVNISDNHGITALVLADWNTEADCIKLLTPISSTECLVAYLGHTPSTKSYAIKELRRRARWGDVACVGEMDDGDAGCRPPSRAVVALAILQHLRA